MNEAKRQSLRVLLAEDSENDAMLLELELRRAGYEPSCERVDTREAMSAALRRQPWDLVIADYLMPKFNGLAALALVKQEPMEELPFIIVSGYITDDTAVAAMKAGAHDYLMKDNLKRLGPAVHRELAEAQARRAQRRSVARRNAEHGITRVLAGAHSLEEAAPVILGILLEGLKMDVAALWLPDPRKRLVVSAVEARGQSSALEAFVEACQGLVFFPGHGLPGLAWEDQQLVMIENLSDREASPHLESAFRAGLRGAMALPIGRSARLSGVLELFSIEQMGNDADLVNTLGAITSELGQFIERRTAEESLQQAHDQLELRVHQRTAELKSANAQLQTSISERKRLENELLEITEKERRRIGLDLHDDLGQKLSGIALMTKSLVVKLARQKALEAREAAKIHSLVLQAISRANDVAHDLATLDLKEQDLASALKQLAAQAAASFNVTCQFQAEEGISELDAHAIMQLYMIAQEAVTNAVKHGKARRVTISLARDADSIVLTVKNTGLPFPDLKTHAATGMGLRIMNYRASLLGASLDVKSMGNRGTLLTCSMPLVTKRQLAAV